jgi:hypothetical protein
MKACLLAVLAFLGIAAAAFAQEDAAPEKDYRGFSLELGTGIQPIHMSFLPTRSTEVALADKGQGLVERDYPHPTVSLSAAWRLTRRGEIVATAGLSWRIDGLTQYEAFGIDPQGKPRYDLQKGSPAGWFVSSYTPSLTVTYRHIWTPDHLVQCYSGGGLGFVPTVAQFVPVPSVTLFGARFGRRHFYAFADLTLGPAASFVHGGLGWHFGK